MMNGIYLLLGSNLGRKQFNLTRALDLIENRIGRVKNASGTYKTEAWGAEDQNWFLNQAVEVETNLSPTDLLSKINLIENEMGRVRKERWRERIIDIDILYYHDLVFQDNNLTIPHPGIPVRRFALMPLVEIASRFIHPIEQKSQLQLLQECPDQLAVERFDQAAPSIG